MLIDDAIEEDSVPVWKFVRYLNKNFVFVELVQNNLRRLRVLGLWPDQVENHGLKNKKTMDEANWPLRVRCFSRRNLKVETE